MRDRFPGIPRSRCRKSGTGMGLTIKSGTETRTQIENLRDSGSELKSEKSGTRDWDRRLSNQPALKDSGLSR